MDGPGSEGLVARFQSLDRLTGGEIRGVPFCVKPTRPFWSRHRHSTWYEMLNLAPATFDKMFEALGNKSQLAKLGIYLVNGCSELNFVHADAPYSKTDTGARLKWYTFGARLPGNSSVKSFHEEGFSPHAVWPSQLLTYLKTTTVQPPAPKRARESDAGEPLLSAASSRTEPMADAAAQAPAAAAVADADADAAAQAAAQADAHAEAKAASDAAAAQPWCDSAVRRGSPKGKSEGEGCAGPLSSPRLDAAVTTSRTAPDASVAAAARPQRGRYVW